MMDPLGAAFWTLFALAVIANAWLSVSGGNGAPARVAPPAAKPIGDSPE